MTWDLHSNRDPHRSMRPMGQRAMPRTAAEWEEDIRRLMDQGEFVVACDMARSALAHHPAGVRIKQLAARALYRTGSLEEARAILEPLCHMRPVDEQATRMTLISLRKALDMPADAAPSPEQVEAATAFLREVRGSVGNEAEGYAEETMGLLGHVYKDLWRRSATPDDGRRARDTYLRAFRKWNSYWTGINAATLSCLIGDQETSEALAGDVLRICEQALRSAAGDARYWIPATMGEAHLLLGDERAAVDAYREAADHAGRSYDRVVSSVRQLRMLRTCGFNVPEEILSLLKLPTVVVFAGHMIDHPERTVPRFPPSIEGAVRREIDRRLRELDARIGYTSAACGSDILFIEAMRDRGAEVNVVLPFEAEDFIGTSVAFAGENWVCRFRGALTTANSVKYVTEEPFLGDEVLFGFGSEIFRGYAELRARRLETRPYLLAVWNGETAEREGGTGELVRRWPDRGRCVIVRTDELLGVGPAASGKGPRAYEPSRAAAAGTEGRMSLGRRLVKAMLFADVVGYSKLGEAQTPFFVYEFLRRVAECVRAAGVEPEVVNTWGDAIFVVMEGSRVVDLVRYAVALRDSVCRTDWRELGLPGGMSIRIALHAGPVFEGENPIRGGRDFFGAHVNRAARIEPVTSPGRIYASEQLAALLTVAQSASGEHAFACDYVGSLPLDKGFGEQGLYHIRERYLEETA